MDTAMKGLLLILAVLYVISPIDAFPGLIDDFLVIMFFSMAAQERINTVD